MVKVSVIIPVYNSAAYLTECLESLRRQTYGNIEIILIDDGSTDDSAVICRQICDMDRRFTYYYQENQGPSAARNNGLVRVNGDYLTFVDSDDVYEYDGIEKMVDKALEYDADLAVFSIKLFGETEERFILANPVTEYIDRGRYIAAVAAADENYGGGFTVAKLWKCSAIREKNDFIQYDRKLRSYEDKIWILENAKGVSKILLCEDIVYQYRILKNSLSHRMDASLQKDRVTAYKKIAEICQDCLEEKELKRVYCTYRMQLMRYLYINRSCADEQGFLELRAGLREILCSNDYNWKSKIKYCYVVFMIPIWRKK